MLDFGDYVWLLYAKVVLASATLTDLRAEVSVGQLELDARGTLQLSRLAAVHRRADVRFRHGASHLELK